MTVNVHALAGDDKEMVTRKTGMELVAQLLGSQADVARVLGVSPVAVCIWKKKGKIPPLRILQIATITCASPELFLSEDYFEKSQKS